MTSRRACFRGCHQCVASRVIEEFKLCIAEYPTQYCLPPPWLVVLVQKAVGAPVGVEFRRDTLSRSNGIGDGFFSTWSADGSILISVNDGNLTADVSTLNYNQHDWVQIPDNKNQYFHNRLYRTHKHSRGEQINPIDAYPYSRKHNSWFGFGILAVDGVIYCAVSKTPNINGLCRSSGYDSFAVPTTASLGSRYARMGLSWPYDRSRWRVGKLMTTICSFLVWTRIIAGRNPQIPFRG